MSSLDALVLTIFSEFTCNYYSASELEDSRHKISIMTVYAAELCLLSLLLGVEESEDWSCEDHCCTCSPTSIIYCTAALTAFCTSSRDGWMT